MQAMLATMVESFDGKFFFFFFFFYYAHFRDYIETVRSNIGVRELIQPKSVIL